MSDLPDDPMINRPAMSRWPPRRADMTHLLDTMLICAVVTILSVRTELYLTNYPQIGGNGLHIAHLLWGGLLMVFAQMILLAFVVPAARQVAAVLGGIGLGLFIDEVGKFITADNNYFFKPTASIIYIVFIAFFALVRQLDRGRVFTQREYLLNAIEMTKDVPMVRLGSERRDRALAMLARADPSDPLVPHVREMLDDPRAHRPRHILVTTKYYRRLRDRLLGAVDLPGFQTAVVGLLGVWVIGSLLQLVGATWFASPYGRPEQVFRYGSKITNVPFSTSQKDFVGDAVIVFTVLSMVLAVIGMALVLRGDRERGFAMFERALLVSIFLTQVFAFVHTQFAAVIGLLIDLALFWAVRAVLNQELEHQALRKSTFNPADVVGEVTG